MSEAYRRCCHKPEEKCESCCTGCELFCLSIPCPINLQLLGGIINLAVDIPCIRIGSGNIVTGGKVDHYMGKFNSFMDKIGTKVQFSNCD